MSITLLEEINQAVNELSKGNKVRGWRAYTRLGKPLESFYNERLGWVIKRPVFILEPRTPLAVRVPTICLRDNWVAQPIVEKTDLKKALITIQIKLMGHKGIHSDLHCGNIGWYKNEALMFDW